MIGPLGLCSIRQQYWMLKIVLFSILPWTLENGDNDWDSWGDANYLYYKYYFVFTFPGDLTQLNPYYFVRI